MTSFQAFLCAYATVGALNLGKVAYRLSRVVTGARKRPRARLDGKRFEGTADGVHLSSASLSEARVQDGHGGSVKLTGGVWWLSISFAVVLTVVRYVGGWPLDLARFLRWLASREPRCEHCGESRWSHVWHCLECDRQLLSDEEGMPADLCHLTGQGATLRCAEGGTTYCRPERN